MTSTDPGCMISWTTIAAISAVEGRHGTHGGAELLFDGTSDDPIVGLALDGVTVDNYGDPVAAIADTDGGRYDGDTAVDRAVGPMQFIPQAWERWKRDGDGDGIENPHDLDDATVATAAYLCSYGSQRSWVTWNTAVHGYNHSNAYVASVKGSFERMARIRLAEVDDGLVWQPTRPAGAYVELPPEPEPDGTVDADGTVAADGTVDVAVAADAAVAAAP
jgi:membrane-bound lytic murein transglycosylase B